MNQQSFRGALEVERGVDGVVVGGARVAVLDLELLNVCDCHFDSLSRRVASIVFELRGCGRVGLPLRRRDGRTPQRASPEDTQDGDIAYARFPPSRETRYPGDLLPD